METELNANLNSNAKTEATSQHRKGHDTTASRALETAAKCAWIFGVWNTVVLAVLIASAISGGTPSVFMWVRAGILVAVSPVLVRLARTAGRGSMAALARLRLVACVLPVAVIVVDFIPGVAPLWYALLQGIGSLVLVPVAVIAWRARRGQPGA